MGTKCMLLRGVDSSNDVYLRFLEVYTMYFSVPQKIPTCTLDKILYILHLFTSLSDFYVNDHFPLTLTTTNEVWDNLSQIQWFSEHRWQAAEQNKNGNLHMWYNNPVVINL